METWKKHLPDYEFMLWDRAQFDIDSSPWVKQAFEAKKYAFAADYIRLYALYHHGGIYLDSDIEVVKPFDESMLDSGLMLGIENTKTNWIEAGCFGAEKGHPFIKKALEYHDRPFENPLVLPHMMYNVWTEHFSNVHYSFYQPEVFTAKSFHTGLITITPNTYTVHHFAGTWHNETERRNTLRRWAYFKRFGDGVLSQWIYLLFYAYPGLLRENTGYMLKNMRKDGFFFVVKRYFNKYLLRKKKMNTRNIT
jgi:hypothetical protein